MRSRARVHYLVNVSVSMHGNVNDCIRVGRPLCVYTCSILCATSWLPGFARAPPSLHASLSLSPSLSPPSRPPHPLSILGGGLKNISIFSAVHEISRTFDFLTPWNFYPLPPGFFKIDFLGSSWHFPDFWFFYPLKLPPPTGFFLICFWFSGQFMIFPGLLICWHPKNSHGTLLGGAGQFFFAEDESHIYPNMCAKFGCGPTVVSKGGGGTDRQTKGTCSFIQ